MAHRERHEEHEEHARQQQRRAIKRQLRGEGWEEGKASPDTAAVMSILPPLDGDPPAQGDQQSPFRQDQGRLELNKASSEPGESPAPSAPLAGRAAGKPGQGKTQM